MWWLDSVLRAQFGKPSGIVGSLIIGPALNFADMRMIDLAIELLEPRPGDTFLDIGFGAGYSIGAIAGKLTRGRLLGVDYSMEMVRLTSAAVMRRPDKARVALTCADVMHLPFAGSAANKVLAANNIYYWPDPVAGLREIARVLKRRGRLAVGLRSPARLRPLTWSWNDFALYEPQEVAGFLERAGFRVRAVFHRDRWLPLDSVVVVGERT